MTPAARYSEDIDLVQMEAGPAGAVMDVIQATLSPWLGKPSWRQTKGRVTLRYGFESGGAPAVKLRLKVEINTREHWAVLGYTKRPFSVRSRWFERAAAVPTFQMDELLATKLRALYQRRKGRDLFDLAEGLRDDRSDPARVVRTFRSYTERENRPVTRAMFERHLDAKLRDPGFGSDMSDIDPGGHRVQACNALRFSGNACRQGMGKSPRRGGESRSGAKVSLRCCSPLRARRMRRRRRSTETRCG
ncbi:MAG: nucleotidyl transferase AbiEii/AbiGii toxin family protein [Gammaproteobacteria bacterium]|nr:nucleotidyl transferase AbiEii/AbiGii toxin family protein [Gammaproteobacteria bacterium]